MTETILETGVSPQYANDWTVVQALREVVQNWSDVLYEYGCKGSITWKGGKATVKDFGPGMEMRHLAIGVSEKADGSVGQFGEGLKLALLVLAREGREVQIRTQGQMIDPVIEYSEAYGTDLLQFRVQDMEARHAAIHQGTTIEVECSKEELKAGKGYFIRFAARRPEFHWFERGKISRQDNDKGFVYVNGAIVGELPGALFSYHLEGGEAEKALNRDRNTVDTAILENEISRAVANTSSTEVMVRILQDVVGFGESWESKHLMARGLTLSTKRARIWKRAWNQLMDPNTVVSSSPAANNDARYRGYEVINTHFWWKHFLMGFGVQSADSLKRSSRVQKVDPKTLSANARRNLRWATKVAEKAMGVDRCTLVVAQDLNGLVGSSSGALGAYDSKSDKVYIVASILEDRHQTLHILLHELVHRQTGFGDLTVGFERALMDVAVNILMDPELRS